MNYLDGNNSRSYICAEVDSSLLIQAEEILETLGITPTAAISQFYRQIVLHRGIPFKVAVPNRSADLKHRRA